VPDHRIFDPTKRRRQLKLLAASLVGVVLVGGAMIPLAKSLKAKPAAEGETALTSLPASPDHWRGQIDYQALNDRLAELMTDPSMTGLAVAVVEDGRLSFVKGYGRTSVDNGEPVDAHTVFRWASLSKTVAGTLTARLAADGVLSLNDPLQTFHTTLRLPGDAQNTLTVEQLLSQRTGLGKNAYDGWLEDGRDPIEIRTALGQLKPVCPPGTCHTYQNIAYDTISEVIAERTGESYGETVRHKLFEPLGMKGASLGYAALTSSAHWARPHRHGNLLTLSEAYYRVPAAAGVNSSILDLAAWMQAQMGLRPDVLSPAVLNEAQRSRVATARPFGRMTFARELKSPGYGLGMRSFDYRGHHLIGHSGAVSGYRSTMLFDPATKTGIVMLWNSDGNLPFRFQAEFFDRAYKLPFTDFLELERPALAPTQTAGGAHQAEE
jgi:beta-lactamase class C